MLPYCGNGGNLWSYTRVQLCLLNDLCVVQSVDQRVAQCVEWSSTVAMYSKDKAGGITKGVECMCIYIDKVGIVYGRNLAVLGVIILDAHSWL